MGSKNHDEVEVKTKNKALDKSSTNGAGNQILDSVIVDPSDKVMKKAMKQIGASFEVMMEGDKAKLEDLLGLGEKLLNLVDTQAVRMEGFAYKQLESGIDLLRDAKKQGAYVIDFAQHTTDRGFDLVGDLAEGSIDQSSRALELVADVKSRDPLNHLTLMTLFVLAFGLGGIYLATKD